MKKEIKKVKESSRFLKIMLPLFFLILLISVFLLFVAPVVKDWIKDGGSTIISEKKQVEKSVEVILKSEENTIIEVVENSMDAVVSIAVSRVDFVPQEGIVDKVSNIGSGFIVDPSGIIITNQHVVSDADVDYKVITNDGKEYEVSKNIA
jgi:S1-C subfamily serine protease